MWDLFYVNNMVDSSIVFVDLCSYSYSVMDVTKVWRISLLCVSAVDSSLCVCG